VQKIKVLLASRPKLLSEVLRNMIARQPDMEVLGEVIDPIELLLAVRTTQAEVVIVTPLDSEEEPRLCRHLLADHPHLKIVTLSRTGEAATLYEFGSRRQRLEAPGEEAILRAIREAIRAHA
jgi:DNA-binding NarL/FixJ family response regulator